MEITHDVCLTSGRLFYTRDIETAAGVLNGAMKEIISLNPIFPGPYLNYPDSFSSLKSVIHLGFSSSHQISSHPACIVHIFFCSLLGLENESKPNHRSRQERPSSH
jgi:hypothetical protein